jgi:hypothetical protein
MIGRKGEEGVYFEEPAGWRKPKAAKLCLFLKSYESKVLTRSVLMTQTERASAAACH